MISREARGWPIDASSDWHTAQTTHFKPYGGQCPVHCVQDSRRARFHPDLHLPDDAIVECAVLATTL